MFSFDLKTSVHRRVGSTYVQVVTSCESLLYKACRQKRKEVQSAPKSKRGKKAARVVCNKCGKKYSEINLARHQRDELLILSLISIVFAFPFWPFPSFMSCLSLFPLWLLRLPFIALPFSNSYSFPSSLSYYYLRRQLSRPLSYSLPSPIPRAISLSPSPPVGTKHLSSNTV